MISPLQSLDLFSRGMSDISAQWRQGSDNQTSPVVDAWTPKRFSDALNEMFARSFKLFDDFCETDSFPDATYTFDDFAKILRSLTVMAAGFLRIVPAQSSTLTKEIDDLRANVDRAQAILDENDFATDMALSR